MTTDSLGDHAIEAPKKMDQSDKTEVVHHSKRNRKDTIQTLVDVFNSLASVDKATFFHCILPTLQKEDIENLKFSISLDRNVDPSKELSENTNELNKTETLRRSSRKRKKPKTLDETYETADISVKTKKEEIGKNDPVDKTRKPMQTRGRKPTRKQELEVQKPSPNSNTSKQKLKPIKKWKEKTCDEDDDDVDMESKQYKGPTLRKNTTISFTDNCFGDDVMDDEADDVNDDVDDDVDDDNDNDYDPLEDEPIKSSTPKSKKSIEKSLQHNTLPNLTIKPCSVRLVEIGTKIGNERTLNKKNPEQEQDEIEEDWDVDKVPAHVIRSLPKKEVTVEHKVLADTICPDCGVFLHSREALALHYARLHMDKKYECKVCNMKFLNENTLRGHQTIHTGENVELKCPVCEEEFHTIYAAKNHQENAHQENGQQEGLTYEGPESVKPKPFQCPVCSQSFFHINIFQKHIATHSRMGEVPIEVDGGGVKFVIDSRQERTTGHAVFLPKIVKEGEKNESSTASSLTISTVQGPILDFICDLCGLTMKTKDELYEHQLTAHNNEALDGEPTHVCPYCGKAFFRKDGLTRHERIHTGEKPYKCKLCNKAFTQPGNLSMHKKTFHYKELNIDRVMCDVCSKTYPSNGALKKHYIVHTGEKNYQCQYCERRFARPRDLQCHERTHTGLKPFQCSVCGKGFGDKSNLKVHEKIHTVGDECPTCLRRFKNVREFRKHRKICALKADILPTSQDSIPDGSQDKTDHENYVTNMHNVSHEVAAKSYVTTAVQDHNASGTVVQSIGDFGNVEFVNESGEPLNQQAVDAILNLQVGQNYYYHM